MISCFRSDRLLKMLSHCEHRQKSFCDMQMASTVKHLHIFSAQNSNKNCVLSLVSTVLTFHFHWNIYEHQTRFYISHSNEAVLPYKEKHFQTWYMWSKNLPRTEEIATSNCFSSGFWFPIVLREVIYHRSLQSPSPKSCYIDSFIPSSLQHANIISHTEKGWEADKISHDTLSASKALPALREIWLEVR